MKLSNSIVTAILRSPLHGTMSRSLVLLTYQGRRSGTEHTLPVQYVAEADMLWIWAGNAEAKTWWRNFETPATVRLRHRGRDITGKASLVESASERSRLLRSYMDRYPYTTPTGKPKFFGQRWRPSDDELDEVAQTIVMVAVDIA